MRWSVEHREKCFIHEEQTPEPGGDLGLRLEIAPFSSPDIELEAEAIKPALRTEYLTFGDAPLSVREICLQRSIRGTSVFAVIKHMITGIRSDLHMCMRSGGDLRGYVRPE